MQKLINVVALLSGLVSLSVLGGAFYLYKNVDTLVEEAREKATEEVKKAVMDAVPGIVGGLMPEMPEIPSMTGGIVNESSQNSVPNVTGGVIPF